MFLKTLSGLLPVDVILRRVESDYCDPLELRGDSLLGVPGLLQAARAGNVVMANAIGSGVVETPALLPFLPGLCRRLLGEELLMPPVATWWCGQEKARRDGHPTARSAGRSSTPMRRAAPDASARPGAARRNDRAGSGANPHLYLGQEYVALSTAPTWQDQRLEPRHLMIRLYAVASRPTSTWSCPAD